MPASCKAAAAVAVGPLMAAGSLVMTIAYGKGRAFHTALGHGPKAMSGLGFQLTPPHFEVIEGARQTPPPAESPGAGR